MIRAIVHADKQWGIGKDNDMMFSLKKDMKFFRETTSGHTVVMGGNTLRSLPNQKPLKNRVNIVLTRGQVCDECVVAHDFDELKGQLKRNTEFQQIDLKSVSVNLIILYVQKKLIQEKNLYFI